ncbi:MAG: hypothetical protein ACJZ72_05250 [Opitutales bacterium]
MKKCLTILVTLPVTLSMAQPAPTTGGPAYSDPAINQAPAYVDPAANPLQTTVPHRKLPLMTRRVKPLQTTVQLTKLLLTIPQTKPAPNYGPAHKAPPYDPGEPSPLPTTVPHRQGSPLRPGE